MYQLRYNARTYHIQGLNGRTCGTLTRYMKTLEYGTQTFDDLAAAVRNARITARVNNRRVCTNCEEYAEALLADTDRDAPRYVDALQALDMGTDVQLYTFEGATIAGNITDLGLISLKLTSVQDDPITVAYADIESFEFYDETAENWLDPVAEAHAADPGAAETATVRHFVCLSCGATNERAECITGPVHMAPRRMLPADFTRYIESRRPVDKDAAAARREAIRAARAQLARRAEEAAATPDPLSPTAQAVIATGDARDEAMRAAYEAEGTDREPALDAIYQEAERLRADASTVHRHARDDYRARDEAARAAAAVEFELADSEAARTQFIAARIAMAAGRTLGSCDGSTLRPHIITPAYLIAERLDEAGNRFGVFVEGMAAAYADTLAEALARVPEALADVAASCEPGDYAPTGCVAAELHECWSRALCEDDAPAPLPLPEPPVSALADVTTAPAAMARAVAVGAALTGAAESETNEGPRMTKFQVTINQVVTTTVYVEAPDREAAVEFAVGELPELCLQCAGGGPKDSPQVSEVNRYVNDHYDEPEVRELDEYGCLVATEPERDAAAVAFAAAIAAGHTPEGSAPLVDVVAELDRFHDEVGVSVDDIFADLESDDPDAEAMRAYDLAEREYRYRAERYSRTGHQEDAEDLDEALDRYRAAAAAARRCSVIGADHSCRETVADGATECPAHLNNRGEEAPRG